MILYRQHFMGSVTQEEPAPLYLYRVTQRVGVARVWIFQSGSSLRFASHNNNV